MSAWRDRILACYQEFLERSFLIFSGNCFFLVNKNNAKLMRCCTFLASGSFRSASASALRFFIFSCTLTLFCLWYTSSRFILFLMDERFVREGGMASRREYGLRKNWTNFNSIGICRGRASLPNHKEQCIGPEQSHFLC